MGFEKCGSDFEISYGLETEGICLLAFFDLVIAMIMVSARWFCFVALGLGER